MLSRLSSVAARSAVRAAPAVRASSFARLSTAAAASASPAANARTLTEAVSALVPKLRSDWKELKTTYGEKDLGNVKLDQVFGGMRGMTGLITETSLLDANEGIRFRGYTIPDCQQALPKAAGGNEPLPEGLLWLLLTGNVPTQAQVSGLTADLRARSALPQHVVDVINAFPTKMHPMSALVAATAALQTESKFAAAYQRGVNKTTYWEYALDDSLDLIARLPEVAARIYRHKFHANKYIAPNQKLDWGANFAHMLGYDSPQFAELMRLYLTIHSDHEGGNVSAHATHLVGSALADPYLSYAAGMAGLAGPLHGLANQEVLRWLMDFRKQFGSERPTKQALIDACWATLKAGRVIPGYGHAVLRKTDPRYTCQREFAQKHLPNDSLFQLVSDLYEVVPQVLTEHGKTANPWPNVDAHSGVLLQHYGFKEEEYYTVLFGVSRALGVLSSLTIDRVYGLPLERPKSIDSAWIKKQFGAK